MSSTISLHRPTTQEEQETVNAVLALQLYRAPSPTATTTDYTTDDEWSSSATATTDDSLAGFFEQLPDHPGEGWVPNDPNSPLYFHFELPAMYGGVVAKYIRYDLSPAYPLVLGTLGKGQPVHSRLLRPRPVLFTHGPFSSQQRNFFRPDQPFRKWVDQAVKDEADPSLVAGVYQYWYLQQKERQLNLLIKQTYDQLDEVEEHGEELMKDLSKANAFERIIVQMNWQGHDDDDDPAAEEALHPYAKLLKGLPPPPPPAKNNLYCKACGWHDHESRDCKSTALCHSCRKPGHSASQCELTVCYRCDDTGHIARDCPFGRRRGRKRPLSRKARTNKVKKHSF
jgi:hypothetical protein